MTLTPQLAQQCLEALERAAARFNMLGDVERNGASAAVGYDDATSAATALREALASGEGDEARDAARLDALEACKADHQWIVARGKDSFTVALKSPYGNCVTRKTLREAIDAAMKGNGNAG